VELLFELNIFCDGDKVALSLLDFEIQGQMRTRLILGSIFNRGKKMFSLEHLVVSTMVKYRDDMCSYKIISTS
jgi:hypothetical protein